MINPGQSLDINLTLRGAGDASAGYAGSPRLRPADGDSSPILLAAIAGCVATGGGEIRLDSGVFEVSRGLVIPRNSPPVRFVGRGNWGVTTIRATQPMGSILEVWSGYFGARLLTLDGNLMAVSCLRQEVAPFSLYEDVEFTNATADGIYLARDGMNDTIRYDNCISRYNGYTYRTEGLWGAFQNRCITMSGTVSVTAGNTTVTGVGTQFTKVPARAGDPIRIGVSPAFVGEIASIDDDTHLTLALLTPAIATATGLDWAIGVGSGYNEESGADNNVARIRNGLYRGNAAYGLQFDGLYGPTVDSPQIDANHFSGIKCGRSQNASSLLSATIMHPYFEGNGYEYWLATALGIMIVHPNPGGATRVDDARVKGILVDAEGLHCLGVSTSAIPDASTLQSPSGLPEGLFWDGLNRRLGIGNPNPLNILDIKQSLDGNLKFSVINESPGQSAFSSFTIGRSVGGDLTFDCLYTGDGNDILQPLTVYLTSSPGTTGGIYLGTNGPAPVRFQTAGVVRMTIDPAGDIMLGRGAVATDAIDGFAWVGSCPGMPTGAPAARPGMVALVWDSEGKRLYAWDGSWYPIC